MFLNKGRSGALTAGLLAALMLSGTAFAQDYAQSPSLEGADLPPVAERVSANPLVLEPIESLGRYGGTMRTISGENLDWMKMLVQVEPFGRFERDVSGVRPNVLESWEWNPEYTEVTLHIREGILWSDGEPLTTDDFMFFWDEVVNNEAIPVTFPAGTVIDNTPMSVEQIDETTMKFVFPAPNPLFMEMASRAYYSSSQWLIPAHYLRQFHPDHSDVADSTAFMAHYSMDSRIQQIGMPTLAGWMVTEYVPGQRVVAQRNPYYWKVDTEGNQLPYIDTIEASLATSDSVRQAVVLNGIAGNLDFQPREFNLSDVGLLIEGQQRGDYTVKLWDRGDFAWPWIMIFYDHIDEGITDLFYQPEFRRALSHAMDRDKYNTIAAYGLATPRQFALSPLSPELNTPEGAEFYQEWVNSFIDYDPELAASLLDEIGVVDADGDGWRDRPDGSRLQLIVDFGGGDAQTVAVMDLIKEDWDAIGVETILNSIDGTAMTRRFESGEMMMRAWGSAAGWGLLSAPTVWAPIEAAEWSMGGRSIALYYQSAGREGTPPRAGSMLEQLQQAYSRAVSTVDPDERNAALLDAYRIHLDEGPITIGTIGEHPSPVLVSNRLHNVPDVGLIGSWDMGFPATADPEQFYFSE